MVALIKLRDSALKNYQLKKPDLAASCLLK